MALTRSFPTQHPDGLPITDTRRITAGRYARNADGTVRPGILPSNTEPIVTGRASMGYNVAPFSAVTSRVNTGAEEIANDALTVVTTTAAPAANSRIDVIWVRSQFMQHADANNDVVFGVTQGAAAANPTKPTIPVGALELATATILSTTTTTATAVITQTHPYTAAAGGVVPFRNLTELTAWAAPIGAQARDMSTGVLFQRNASSWASSAGLVLLQRIEFAAATSVSFAGFSAAFEDYVAILEINSSSAPAGGTMRMRSGGVNNAAAEYTAQQEVANGTAVTASRVFQQPAFPMVPLTAVEHTMHIEFSRPAVAAATRVQVDAQSVNDPNTLWGSKLWGRHNVASAFDGFSYIPSGGNAITGSLSVYGRA